MITHQKKEEKLKKTEIEEESNTKINLKFGIFEYSGVST